MNMLACKLCKFCMLKTEEKQRPMSWICNPYPVQFNVLRLCMNLVNSSLGFYVK